jgi:hypothetical protein
MVDTGSALPVGLLGEQFGANRAALFSPLAGKIGRRRTGEDRQDRFAALPERINALAGQARVAIGIAISTQRARVLIPGSMSG